MNLSAHWNSLYRYKKLDLFRLFKPRPVHKSSLECFLEMNSYPYLQPIVSAITGEVIGAEILLRFIDKDGSCYAPGTVIEELENSRHINKLTVDLINNIHQHFLPIASNLPNDFFFTFNICSSQLANDPLREAALKFSDNFNMVLEIIERSVLEIDDDIQVAVEEMSNEGIQFAIDDFGAGHTSLKYLEIMNFSFLKIDRDLTRAHQGKLIYKNTVCALVELARKLNMSLIAEGVETQEQVTLLTEAGAELLQGYHYSMPLSVPHFIKEYF